MRERTHGRRGRALGAVLAVLDARGLATSEDQRARILGCTDLEQLERWVRAAVVVTEAEALFAAVSPA